MKTKNVIFILCLLLVLSSITAIDASYVDDEAIQIADDTIGDTISSNEASANENIANDANYANDEIIQTADDTAGDAISSNEASANENIGKEEGNEILDASFSSLQSKIDNAAEGSEINLTENYYISEGGDTIKIKKSITINGNNHILKNNKENVRILELTGDKKSVILKNIIFEGGDAGSNNGGAILNTHSSTNLTLIDCKFNSNKAGNGGAIYTQGKLDVRNCNFTQNKATKDNGGAIYSNAPLNITNSFFESNIADVAGGAIYSEGSSVISYTNFNKNKADGATFSKCLGGAIRSVGHAVIDKCAFYNNYADNGGAIYSDGILDLKAHGARIYFEDNSAKYSGGAVYACTNLYINWDANLFWGAYVFSKNSAKNDDGGAIYCEGNLYANYFEALENTANVDGGAVFCKGETHINKSRIDYNKAQGASISRCYGGGLRSKGKCYIDSSDFWENYAENYGGAIYADEDIIITGYGDAKHRFVGNKAKYYGGAIYACKDVYIDPNRNSKRFALHHNEVEEDNGGGIYCEGNVYAHNADITLNGAKVDGGGIYCKGQTTLINCYINDNHASGNTPIIGSKNHGGGVYSKGSVTIENCQIDGNSATNYGGAVYTEGELKLKDTTFWKNHAKEGGAIYAYIISEPITNATFHLCHAESGDGGAIYVLKECNLELLSCLFYENNATGRGGAVYLDSSSSNLKVSYCSFVDNKADKKGQSIFNSGKYSSVDMCWFGSNNPNLKDQFKEWGLFSDKDYEVKNYLRLSWIINDTELYKDNFYNATIHFSDLNGKPLQKELPHNLIYIWGSGVSTQSLHDHADSDNWAIISFVSNNATMEAHIDHEAIIKSFSVKDKQTSEVIITSCNNITYPDPLEIEYEITNRAENATYAVRNAEGKIVKEGTLPNGNSLYIYLEEGSYSITITNPETKSVRQSNATANFIVKRIVSARITANNVSYGQPTRIVLRANIDGLYNINLNNQVIQIEVVDRMGSAQVMLDAGKYQTITTAAAPEYEMNINETTFTVKKANINLTLDTSNQISYPQNITGIIKTNVFGEYLIYLNDKLQAVNISTPTYEFSFDNLDAGKYTLYVVSNISDNYNPATVTRTIDILKEDISLLLFVSNTSSSQEVEAFAFSSLDGEYTIKVGNIEKTMNIIGNVGQISLGHMNAGTYKATIEFEGDKNHNPASDIWSFDVYETDSIFKLNLSSETVIYGDEILITPDLPENATGNIEYYLNGQKYAELPADEELKLSKLDVGHYLIHAVYSGDSSHNSTDYDAVIEVNKSSNNVIVNVTNVTYGTPSIINVFADADGTYTVNISGNIVTVDVIGGTGSGLANLDAGTYSTSTDFSSENYETTITEANFEVKKAINNVNVSVADVTYGEESIINIIADIDGEYTVNINGTRVTVNVKGGKGNSQTKLSHGKYTTETTFADNNYDSIVNEASFNVKKLKENVTLSIIMLDTTYPSEANGTVYANVDGEYNVTVGNISRIINVENGMGKFNMGVLDAGDYDAIVSFEGNEDYNANTNDTLFTVKKADITLSISIEDCMYGDDIEVNITASVDGEYTIIIGPVNTTVNVVNNVASKVIEDALDVEEYTGYVIFKGAKNYRDKIENTTFRVYKAFPTFEISVNNTVFNYGEPITINHQLTEGATGSIEYYLANGTMISPASVDLNYTLPVFDIGFYEIVAAYCGDINYYEVLANLTFTIVQAENNAEVRVNNVTYGEDSIIEVTADADGDYLVDINGTIYNITVKDGLGSLPIRLDAGSYYANLSFANENYRTTIKNTEFQINKAANNVIVNATDVTYGEYTIIKISADIDGKYSVDINGTSYEIEVNNGFGTKSIRLNAGTYTTETTFSDGNHETIAVEDSFEVAKADNNIILVVDNSIKGPYAILFACDVDGSYQVTLNNTPVSGNVNNGIGFYDAGELDVGEYNVNVIFSGNENFNPATASASFTIFEEFINATMNSDASDINVGDDAVITVTLPDDAIGTVTVAVDGMNYTETVKNGTAIISIPDLKSGQKTADIYYSGGGQYNPAKDTVSFAVKKYSTEITANAVETTYKVDGYLVITLKDSTGKAISGVEITVDLNGAKTYTTDENGQVKINVAKLVPNTYVAKVSFAGNENYTQSNATAKVTVNKAKANLISKAVKTSYRVKKYMVITLKDSTGNPLKGAKIAVKLKGTKTYTTNKNGQIKINVAKLVPKTYTAKITFLGDKYHVQSSKSVKVTVKKAKPKIIAKKKTFKRSVKVKKYKIKLKSGKTPIKKVKVTLKINKKTYKAKTNKKGVATFKIKKLAKKGKYKAVIKAKGNKYYKKASKKVKISIK